MDILFSCHKIPVNDEAVNSRHSDILLLLNFLYSYQYFYAFNVCFAYSSDLRFA